VVKGVSEKGALAIVEARNNPNPVVVEETKGRGKAKTTTRTTYGPGRFVSMEDFRARVAPRAVNNAAMEKLDKVGAFARIEPGQLPSTHSSRQRNQIELMPAISEQGVQADRKITVCEQTWDQLTENHEAIMEAFGDEAVDTKVGKNPKMMFILDAPFNDYQEPKQQYSFQEYVAPALHEAGLCLDDVVWTYVLRRPLKKGERDLPAKEVAQAMPFLKRDIEILKPPVIVLLGPTAIKSFFPDIKGLADHIGRMTYSAELDATVIIGFKPTQLYHDAEKKGPLKKVFEEAKKLVENT
jgi:DNA polymerase-3 subunit alpha